MFSELISEYCQDVKMPSYDARQCDHLKYVNKMQRMRKSLIAMIRPEIDARDWIKYRLKIYEVTKTKAIPLKLSVHYTYVLLHLSFVFTFKIYKL